MRRSVVRGVRGKNYFESTSNKKWERMRMRKVYNDDVPTGKNSNNKQSSNGKSRRKWAGVRVT